MHSEEATGAYRGELHGLQLWLAQPDDTRHGAAAFEHRAELPRAELRNGVATVLVGAFGETLASTRRHPTCRSRSGPVDRLQRLPVQSIFEYGLIVLSGALQIDDQTVRPGQLAYLGAGRTALEVRALERTRMVLIGGEPFAEPILMWWNFVGRSREEIDLAYEQWQAGAERFGRVDSPLPRIAAPPLVWTSAADHV